MANTKSAIKAARKTERQTVRNKAVKTRLKTLHKKFSAVATSGDKEAVLAAGSAYASAMDRATKSGVVHRNAASRAKSHVAAALKSK
jgi:small subunit ribosomal protein S20